MSVSRTHRLIRLLQLLQSGRDFDAEGLADSLNVSRRTLFRDLNLLEAANVPFSYDRKSQRYSINKEYFLPPVNLSMAEALALMLTTRKIAGRRIHPDYKRAVDAAMKIEGAIPEPIRRHCGRLLDNVEVRYGPVSDVEGIGDLMGVLHRAMNERRKLSMTYDSYIERSTIEVVLHPYRKVFMGRAWYIIGYSELHKSPRTFKIERVERAELLAEQFEPKRDFDLDDYLGNAWQMIRGEDCHRVRIRFLPKVAGNVEEVLWHKTQRTRRESDGSLIFEVDVDGLGEISWWILGYGDQAEVLEPEQLRETIARHARNILEKYNGAAQRQRECLLAEPRP